MSEVERAKMGNIIFVSKEINDESHCGVIDQLNAKSLNTVESYIESVNFNSCLNKKISVDSMGNVKNCPSLTSSYGFIEDVDLLSIVNTVNFKKYGGITKKQVKVCDVCEFRKICSDCRAYTIDDDLYGKPKKCDYDPYTNEWK